MPFKPNYRLERADRNRAKQAKKEAKLQQRRERSELRKTGEDETALQGDEDKDETNG